jgi:hypothetical protein
MGSGYTGKKVQHGTGAVERYTGPSINISSLPLDLQYAASSATR